MASHHLHYKISLNITFLVVLLSSLFFHPTPALADENPIPTLPDLASFSYSLLNGQPSQLRGVYVPYVLAMPVVQQPTGNPGYVSTEGDVITEFGMATEIGNVGLLAHNTLSGATFLGLLPGQEVTLIYGDGRMEDFVISTVLRFQALDPYSPYSEFRDLSTGITLTASDLFQQVYRGEHHVTFQTCIEANGNPSWGRLFVIAEPAQDP